MLAVPRLCLLLVTTAALGVAATPQSTALPDEDRNAYVITDSPYYLRGYDWWWHNFEAVQPETQERRSFFIQYLVMNPAGGGNSAPVFGQINATTRSGDRPSYARLAAGTWGEGKVQLFNYYPLSAFEASAETMQVSIGGSNTANETALKGSVSVTSDQANAHPEWLSDAGSITWDLTVEKVLTFSTGIAGALPLVKLAIAQMGWHVQGMQAKYSGTVTFNGATYIVDPETSYGYQDKNFGWDFTNPWYWISCNNFKNSPGSSLVVGGGQPVLFGIPQGKKVLVAFSHKGGELYKWNFADVPFGSPGDYIKQAIDVGPAGENIQWSISSEDPNYKIIVNMTCPKSQMLRLRYENPDGFVNHKQLWNGADLSGSVQLFSKAAGGNNQGSWSLIDTLVCERGAGEYGEYKLADSAAAGSSAAAADSATTAALPASAR
uniref:AttH domain-containing protein n=1 Tax=Tetradesmus obliquus TaxID=3088 RepID=A0A383VCP8_TETOB|eukprot:jgi/Sobl393_1/18104/SZX62710.1